MAPEKLIFRCILQIEIYINLHDNKQTEINMQLFSRSEANNTLVPRIAFSLK